MKSSTFWKIACLLIAAFSSVMSAAEYVDESPESEYEFNPAWEMSKSYPERASIHALSRVKTERTKIPEELRRIIYEFGHDPLRFLSGLQRRVINFIEGHIESHLKTREWNGMRLVHYKGDEKNLIHIASHYDTEQPLRLRFGDLTDIEGKMTQSEMDCMNQMLLKRNPMLTIQKTHVKSGLYAITLDGADGRPSYIDPTVKNYCHSIASHGEYKSNPFPGNDHYKALNTNVEIINFVGEGVSCNKQSTDEVFKTFFTRIGEEKAELKIIDFEVRFKEEEETAYGCDAVEVSILYKYPQGEKRRNFSVKADDYDKWHYAMRGALVNYGDFTIIEQSDDSMAFRWIRNTSEDCEVD